MASIPVRFSFLIESMDERVSLPPAPTTMGTRPAFVSTTHRTTSSIAKYEKVRDDEKPAETYDRVSADFQLILDKYGSKQSGKIARLTYANICYQTGKYDQAIELYKRSLVDFEKQPAIHNQVTGSLGYAHEQKQDYAIAVGYFEQLSSAPESIIKGEALYHLGWLYDKLGQTEKSKDAYNKILSDHQDFIYIDLVKEKMAG